MPDMFDLKKRSEIMSKVRSADTTPELRVRGILESLGYFIETHRNDLPGNPDIVLPAQETIIFVHGCFWHGCPTCRRAKIRPVANAGYWSKKLDRKIERDKNNIYALEKMGWRVLVIWECETKIKQLPLLGDKLSEFLKRRT